MTCGLLHMLRRYIFYKGRAPDRPLLPHLPKDYYVAQHILFPMNLGYLGKDFYNPFVDRK